MPFLWRTGYRWVLLEYRYFERVIQHIACTYLFRHGFRNSTPLIRDAFAHKNLCKRIKVRAKCIYF